MKNTTASEDWLTLVEAWETFYSGRPKSPTHEELQKVVEICEDAGASRFLIRDDNEIIFSENHTVHINPGFILVGQETRHVSADATYARHGFTHRLKFLSFSEFGEREQDPPVPGKVLCPIQGVKVLSGRECDYCGGIH